MQTGYNNSKRNLFTKVVREPTHKKPGRLLALHATKGYRMTTTDRIKSKTFNAAQKFYHALGAQV